VAALNRLSLPQGLHAPLVATGALVVFALAQVIHASGFLAVYLAGMIVGNRPTRAHNAIIVFLDAATWLAQIVMFVLLGLLAWPGRLYDHLLPALAVAATLMFFARPLAVFLCLAPFRFAWREKAFISWVGLRGAVGIFLASIPLLVGLANAQLFFDIGFVVVLVSLLVQGWTIAFAAQKLHIALPRSDPAPRRVELDLPGQLEHELVGYSVGPNNPYLRRRLAPSWAKLMLIVRAEHVLTAAEADGIREGDYAYFLAPPEKAQALDRFFVDMPPPATPDLRLLGDFFVSGEVTLGTLGEIYGLAVAAQDGDTTLADWFAAHLHHKARVGDRLALGTIHLVVDAVAKGRVTTVGLDLADDAAEEPALGPVARIGSMIKRMLARLGAL
jgi:potassium/hydrogen antiporter